MHITLKPEHESMIREMVESGRHSSASEVVREALRLMERQDREEQFRTAVAVGLDDFARGDVVEWTSDSLDRITREAAEEDRRALPIRRDVLPS